MYRKSFVFPLLCIIIIPKIFQKIKKDRHTASLKAYPGGGHISGEKSFAYPVSLLRGLFHVEMVCEFVVIVAVASYLQENRVKSGETMQNGGNTHQFLHYHRK